MDKKIIDFIKSYNITDLEIEDMKSISVLLDVTTFEEFMTNASLLIEYGYPKSDLDVLLLNNPYIFTESASVLKSDLESLKSKYGDIEEILKEDPTII